jgi:amino acid adenylation domain-containing protein
MNRTVQDIYPLSPTQRGLLFHSLYGQFYGQPDAQQPDAQQPDLIAHSQTGAYIVQVSYRLLGKLNRMAFEQAWQQLVARHTILRTAFVWDKLDLPVQVVGQQAILPIYWQDWQPLSPAQQQQKSEALLVDDRAQGFNLSSAPLMRIHAIQLSANCYQIIWTHHHILLDGWSLPLLLKEWITLYQVASGPSNSQSNSQSDLVQSRLGPAYPYRDYIAWLQQQDLASAKQFWREQLSGFTAPTALGIDSAEGDQAAAVASFKAQSYQLPSELTQQLKAFAQQHRLTLSSLVQGAWSKILSVYSGEQDVLYGLACAGRPESLPAAEQRVGLFINTLPMRIAVSPDSQIVPWLQQIQQQQLAQQPYEYTPLVDIQAVSDLPRRSPLFESVIVFENYPLESASGIEELDLQAVAVIEQTHYPLTLFAAMTADGLTLKALYNVQRLSQAAIDRLFTHFHTVLAAMVTAGERPLKHINILSAAEQQFLADSESPRSGAPAVLPSVQAVIAQQAAQTPHATAIIFAGETLSYSQINRLANQLSHYLRQQGVPSGALIGLCVERSVEMVISLLAILKAGCAYVPLDPSYPPARLQYAIKDAGIDWIIGQNETLHGLELGTAAHLLREINLSQAREEISKQPTSEPDVAATTGEDLAYLIYTSGSTGQPKGVPIRHKSLSNLLQAMGTRLQIKPGDTLMSVTTLAFDIAALELFLPLISGARLLLTSDETARNSHQLMAYLDSYGVDLMQATPATWRLLLNSGWAGQSNLKILCGGEALDIALAQRLLNCGEEVWNLYGPTETTIWSAALALSPTMLSSGSVPIGHPIDNTQFYILNQQQQQVPVGVAGELYIGGVGLSPGYWQQARLTAERFVAVDGLGLLYRTGDRVRYREDGTLDYLGRLDYQAKLRGYRIELGEIEAAIVACDSVDQAVVVIQGEQPDNQRLAAYMTLTRGAGNGVAAGQAVEKATEQTVEKILEKAVRSHLTSRLPHYMIPTAYQVLSAFPLTPNGKIDRSALPAITRPAITPSNQPKTAIETALSEIWQSVLALESAESAVESVGIHDNFFEIGGHSLLLVNAQSQIRQRLGVELSMVDLFRYPTLSTLAAHIGQIQMSQIGEKDAAKERSVALAAGKQRLKQRLRQRKPVEMPVSFDANRDANRDINCEEV